jgi:Xaa-Pro aminopeptidase
MGWEVDRACREVIEQAGYGGYFIHRTGHNIDETDHGNGAHIDNYETQDRRQLLRGTCFSIEPGIYLPGKFGVRLEYDVFIHPDGLVQISGGIQEQIVCLLK